MSNQHIITVHGNLLAGSVAKILYEYLPEKFNRNIEKIINTVIEHIKSDFTKEEYGDIVIYVKNFNYDDFYPYIQNIFGNSHIVIEMAIETDSNMLHSLSRAIWIDYIESNISCRNTSKCERCSNVHTEKLCSSCYNNPAYFNYFDEEDIK